MDQFKNNLNMQEGGEPVYHGEMGPVLHEDEDELLDVESENLHVSEFSLKQEVLRMYGIEIQEEDPYDPNNIEGTLKDPKIKDRMYEAIVLELQAGNSHPLEAIFGEELLSKAELQERGIKNLKETALKILRLTKGQLQSRDSKLFVATGILTQEEAGDVKYIH